MPHIIIEYADQAEIAERIEPLLDEVVAFADASSAIVLENLKLRAVPIQHYRVSGRGDPFIHSTVALMHGRTSSELRTVVTGLHDLIAARFADVHQITVELREFEQHNYQKRQDKN